MSKQCEVCGTSNGKIYGKRGKFKMDLCGKHWSQMSNHGRILGKTRFDNNELMIDGDIVWIITVDLNGIETGKVFTDVKYIDRIKEWKWCLASHGYAIGTRNGMRTKLHRFIMDCPEDMVVDHINHNTSDNRESNLRICTRAQNMANQSIAKDNKSRCTGVNWDTAKKSWRAYITINKRRIHLGNYQIKQDAIDSRLVAQDKYFGQYSNKESVCF